MYRNKLTRRFLALSAALSLALCQSAFAGETVELNLDDDMQRALYVRRWHEHGRARCSGCSDAG